MNKTERILHAARAKPVYETEEAALKRVQDLIELGIWPGITHSLIGYSLTYDPQFGKDPWTTVLF